MGKKRIAGGTQEAKREGEARLLLQGRQFFQAFQAKKL